jgi:nitrite reductase/ring-hydroxylating ferredoxin subunit
MSATVARYREALAGILTRRELFRQGWQFLAAGTLGGVLAAIIAFFYPTDVQEFPTEPVPAGSPQDLPMGKARVVPFGRYPAIVINTPQGLRAYVAVCTHFACIVKWDESKGIMACPCHDGFFNARDGSVISGPPPRPLKSLPVSVVDGQIYISTGSVSPSPPPLPSPRPSPALPTRPKPPLSRSGALWASTQGEGRGEGRGGGLGVDPRRCIEFTEMMHRVGGV